MCACLRVGGSYSLLCRPHGLLCGHTFCASCIFDHARLSPARETRLEDLPPAIIATAGFDPLVDDGAAYAQLLRGAGVDVTYRCYDSLAHGFTAFTGVVPAARQACEEIASLVADAYDRFEIEDD